MLKELYPPETVSITQHPTRILGGPLLAQAHALMHTERLSAGGNIRDKTVEDLKTLVADGGQLWGWVEKQIVLSVCTLERKIGDRTWWYLNNGVTRTDMRGRGLSGQLVDAAVRVNGPSENFIVMYVRQGLFERLNFTQITVDQLSLVDRQIADIIRSKLRPDKIAYIFIKLPEGRTHLSPAGHEKHIVL